MTKHKSFWLAILLLVSSVIVGGCDLGTYENRAQQPISSPSDNADSSDDSDSTDPFN